MIYSDTPAIDDGSLFAQVFIGTETQLVDAYGMKSEKQFVNTLEDHIRERGAMSKLISDQAQSEVSNRVKDILRAYCIADWQSEAMRQWQNFAECKIQTIKAMVNLIMDRTGSPPYLWLLCVLYVCFLLNHTATESLHWETPLKCATGSTPDISPLLRFHWKEPVYYMIDDSPYPSGSKEKRGIFVGIAEHVGHAMMYKVLTDDTKRVIYCSNVCSALDPKARNLRLDPLRGEDVHSFVKSASDNTPEGTKSHSTPVFHHQYDRAGPGPLVGGCTQ